MDFIIKLLILNNSDQKKQYNTIVIIVYKLIKYFDIILFNKNYIREQLKLLQLIS